MNKFLLASMKKYLTFFGKSVTAKGTTFLLSGSIISNLVGFVVIALLTRNLSSESFGLFITAFTFSQLLADLFEFGINPATLTYTAAKSAKEKLDFLKTSFVLKSGAGLLLLGSIFFGAPLIADFAFQNDAILPYIRISAFGSFILLLLIWGQTLLNMENRFFSSSIINSSSNFFRLVAVGFLVFFHQLDPYLSFAFFQFSIIFSLILFLTIYGVAFLKGKFQTMIAKQLLVFGLPIGFSFSLGAIISRIDQLAVFTLVGSAESGVYGLAYRLVSVFILGISAFTSVISPRIASIDESEYDSYFKKTCQVILVMILGVLLSTVIAPLFIPLLFSEVYQSSIILFQILAVGVIFFMIQIPPNSEILFRKKKSGFLIPLSIVSLGVMYLLLQLLVPLYGSIGAAVSFVLLNLFQAVFYVCYFFILRGAKNK